MISRPILFSVVNEYKLGDCLTLLKDGTHSSIKNSAHGYPLLSAKDIDQQILIPANSRLISEEDYLSIYKGYELQPKDILLTIVGTIGRIAIVPNNVPKVAFQRSVAILRANESLNPIYLSYLLQSSSVQKQIQSKVKQGAQGGIYLKDLATVVIKTHDLALQQKIADFFSTLDEKIELIDKKIQKCAQLRDGLITAVFEQQLRLHNDDGSSFTDWTVKTIAEVADVCGGGTPSTSIHEYWDGDIQWITPSEIDSKYVHSSKRTISELGMKNSSAKPLPKGALLLTTRASIGLCSINQYEGTVCTNQGFQSLICHSGIDPEYMYYVVTSKNFVTQMMSLASGSTFLEISSKNLKKIPISVPSNEEQRKIAQFFSLQDERIENLRAQKNALLSIKKSFMQQMFV